MRVCDLGPELDSLIKYLRKDTIRGTIKYFGQVLDRGIVDPEKEVLQCV